LLLYERGKMHKLKIESKKNVFEFIFDKHKIIIGDNYKRRFEIINSIRCFFNKISKTEYSSIKNFKNNIYLNENYLESRRHYFFELGIGFELSSDLKLGSKSILLKYLEVVFEGIEFFDDVSNVNRLLDIFIKEFFEEQSGFGNLTLNVDVQPINAKTLIKMLELCFLKECFITNESDLTYEDNILMQLEMINKISILSKEKEVFAIINVPLLTKKIYEKICELEKGVALVFIDFIEKDNFLSMNEVYLLDRIEIDLMNEEELFELQMNHEKNLSLEQLRKDLFVQCDRFIANDYNIDE